MFVQSPTASESEARDLAQFSQEVRNSWKKMLEWWVVSVVSLEIGSGNDFKEGWGLLYGAGVLAVLPALWFTFWVVWFGVPVLVAKLPEPWRPLANVAGFLLWASTPLCGYSLIKPEQHIRFDGVFAYLGLHGYFVAGLFIVGLYAFAAGRRKKSPPHIAIQPYLMIPILVVFAIAVLGGMEVIPSNSDSSTREMTGLSPALVWYA